MKNDLPENIKKAFPGADKARKLDLDAFGEIMDEVIRKSFVALLVYKDKGEQWHVRGGSGGAVMDFYILLNAVQPIFEAMLESFHGKMDGKNLAGALTEELRKCLENAAAELEAKADG